MRRPTHIEFAKGLKLPIDAATQTFGFFGRKRGGKSYAATKMVEGLVGAGVQTIVLDTVGKLFGLRLAADGKSPGLDMPIMGGLRGDIPLNPDAGALVATAVVETGRSFIIDVAQFSKSARQRFLYAFGERLWQLKKAQREPQPIHLVIEEAQLVIPQMVFHGQEEMVGVWEEIVRLGGNYGIGVSLISQRPQSVNKEVSTQVECLVVLQMNGVPEKKAIKAWIVEKGLEGTDLIEELPSLPRGTAFIWSPQWLEHFGKHEILPKWTFDSTMTPRVGVKTRSVKLKPLDVEKLKAQMEEVVKKGEETDVRALQAKVKTLGRALTEWELGHKTDKRIDEIRQTHEELYKKWEKNYLVNHPPTPTLDKQQLKLLKKHIGMVRLSNGALAVLIEKLDKQRDRLAQSQQVVTGALENLAYTKPPAPVFGDFLKNLTPDFTLPNKEQRVEAHTRMMEEARARASVLPPGEYKIRPVNVNVSTKGIKTSVQQTFNTDTGKVVSVGSDAFKLVGKMKDMLSALNVRVLSRDDLATAVGMAPGSGGFNNYLGALKTAGLIDGSSHGLQLSHGAGRYVTSTYDLSFWAVAARHGSAVVGKMKNMLTAIAQSEVQLSRDALADAVEMARGSGGFNNYVGTLKSRGLIHSGGGMLVLNPVFPL